MINFTCTKCGACCKNTPSFNFLEMIQLSDEFIFQMSHHGFLAQESNLPEKSKLLHYQNIAHTVVLPEFNASMFYHIGFSALQLNSYTSCSKLSNNECTIYGKRPNFCKLLPGSSTLSLSNQEKQIQIFKKNVLEHQWEM